MAITFVLLHLSSTGRDIYRNSRNARFLLAVFGCYFLLLSLTNSVERNYVLFLAVPVVTLSAIVISRKPPLLILFLGASVLYSLAVVYRVNIGFQTTRNYGSIDPTRRNNDYGIKVLGYLIRSGQLEVSRGPSERDPIGLFLDFEGAEYYLGARFRYLPMEHIQSGYLDEYEKYILAFRHNDPSHENQYILETVENRELQPIGYILDGVKVLITLYSNKPTDKVRYFQLDDLNPRFDREFGDLDRLPKAWLGRF
jgi:hypothetical protein